MPARRTPRLIISSSNARGHCVGCRCMCFSDRFWTSVFRLKVKERHLLLIVDARRAHQYFRAPLSTCLVSGQGFSLVELQYSLGPVSSPGTDDNLLDSLDCEAHWHVSAGDVEHASHNMISPAWLWHFFALSSVSALGKCVMVTDCPLVRECIPC